MPRLFSRKDFVKNAGMAIAASSVGFPSVLLPKKKDKLGVALVGLGSYSSGLLAPGLQQTQHCELRGIVTGTPSKVPVWQERYGIPDANVYNYETMHEIDNNDDIDIVYIVVPPGLHAEYSIIGADAGKHVWCEKPMARTLEECQSIIDATTRNKVQLTIGYRMQHEPNTQTIIEYGRTKKYGAIREIRSGAGFRGRHGRGNWRANVKLGGGAMFDMGVYPLNAARYATQKEPIAVSARQYSDREDLYYEVDEHTQFTLWFPGGTVAHCETSFGRGTNYLDIDAENGSYHLRPFQSYRGVRGETSDGILLPANPSHQQARQMDNDALAIKEKKSPIVSGEEGLRDIAIVEAIQESSRNGEARIQL